MEKTVFRGVEGRVDSEALQEPEAGIGKGAVVVYVVPSYINNWALMSRMEREGHRTFLSPPTAVILLSSTWTNRYVSQDVTDMACEHWPMSQCSQFDYPRC